MRWVVYDVDEWAVLGIGMWNRQMDDGMHRLNLRWRFVRADVADGLTGIDLFSLSSRSFRAICVKRRTLLIVNAFCLFHIPPNIPPSFPPNTTNIIDTVISVSQAVVTDRHTAHFTRSVKGGSHGVGDMSQVQTAAGT